MATRADEAADSVNYRRRARVPLWFLLLMLTFLTATAQNRVVGYYPMWERTAFPASYVQFDVVTHINHAFAWPDTDGTISTDDNVVDTALINTAHRAGRKILLSFGGAGTIQTNNFAKVTADSTLRKTFVSNVVAHLTANHYDGADLDWEGPASAAQKTNEVAFVKELRTAFQAVDTTLLITMAIGVSDWSGQWRDYATLKQYVNWFNAMEYDYHGSWSSVAGHNAPLNIGTDPNSDPDAYSIVQSIQYLAGTRAIPKSQLVLGLPFYGKLFGTSALYTSYSGEEDLTYRDVLSTVQSGAWTYTWDAGSNAPTYVSVSPAKLITFDDSASIALKCQYVKTQGISGVMIWELSQDLINRSQPLMDVVRGQMTTTGVSPEFSPAVVPAAFVLFNNYPNPFNPSTTITFSLPSETDLSIKVYDVLGREIATLFDGHSPAGERSVRFDASRYGIVSGVYFYRMRAGAFVQTKKMMLLQ